jgi:AraC family transcriptional activator of pobA
MRHEYFHSTTKSFFSVQSISDFRKNNTHANLNKWFTIFILTDANGEMAIDEQFLSLNKPIAIFITPGQHTHISADSRLEGYAIAFNQEFYCVEYHDSEVSCQGLLFVNNFSSVHFLLDQQQLSIYSNTAKEMVAELENIDPLKDEMLKNLLKNLLIRSNRLFRAQKSIGEVDDANIDFARKFSDLVEKNFKEIKQVESYADMMGIASASLTKKLQKFGIDSPSRIIKNRAVTEAKRLLMYTDKSVKEISAIIGYDDPFYFSRLFSKETGVPPSEFKKYHSKS